MLSIIVCSVNERLYSQLSENIIKTIGKTLFELIKIDNHTGKYSIAEAYNLGIKKSKNPFLLFIHEDVLFKSQNWGEELLSFFQVDPEIGLIGIAGSKIKTKFPTGWWENHPDLLCKYVIQHYPNGGIREMFAGFEDDVLEEVVVIDGVFIGMKKSDNFEFDEELKGFHFYDQSISLIAREIGYKVMVTNKILIEHFSYGNKDNDWLNTSVKFQIKYNQFLPQKLIGKHSNIDDRISCKYFLENCVRTGNRKLGFNYWLKYLILSRFSSDNRKYFNFFVRNIYS